MTTIVLMILFLMIMIIVTVSKAFSPTDAR